jgi:TrmH family RNA methyltransferase
MKVNPITSLNNPLLKQIRGLHQRSMREKTGLFIIEGPKAIAEAFDKQLRVRDVVVSQTFWKDDAAIIADRDVPTISIVEDKLIKELATTTSPTGIIATAEMPRFELDDLFRPEPALVVIVHAIQDPGNLGTLFRTALAASATGVILTRGTVDAYNPKVVRAAMGALFGMPLLTDMLFETACATSRDRGLRIVGCEPTAKVSLFDVDLTGPVAIVLGNEGQGFSSADLDQVDEQIAIPMNPKSESLNVAMSGAVVLFNVVQQRLKAKSI